VYVHTLLVSNTPRSGSGRLHHFFIFRKICLAISEMFYGIELFREPRVFLEQSTFVCSYTILLFLVRYDVILYQKDRYSYTSPQIHKTQTQEK